MNAFFLGFSFFLIFGLGRPARPAPDIAKTVRIASKIPCDGYTAPEDNVTIRTTFSPGGTVREFVLSRFHKDSCEVNVKIKCLHSEKAGWGAVWSSNSLHPARPDMFPIHSCYAWGSNEMAQYVLSGWYKEGAPDSKLPWKQAVVKQVSSSPDVYEFTGPKGGTAQLEMTHR